MKDTLRKDLLEKLVNLSDGEKRQRSSQVLDHCVQYLYSQFFQGNSTLKSQWKKITIGLYHPLVKTEVDWTKHSGFETVLSEFLGDGWRESIYYPAYEPNDAQSLHFHNASGNVLDPDLFFVPGLGFTKKGFRLGRGKGYYDYYFQQLLKNQKSFFTVGLGFQLGLVNENFEEEFDIPMDVVITEKEMYKK